MIIRLGLKSFSHPPSIPTQSTAYLFQDREALVSLLCDFVEAMNPGLLLARSPVILKDRDLAGELKDVWLTVQNKREREKGLSQDVMYKVMKSFYLDALTMVI